MIFIFCGLVGDLTGEGLPMGSPSDTGDVPDQRGSESGSPSRHGVDGVHTEKSADPIMPGFRASAVARTPQPLPGGREVMNSGVHRNLVQQQASSQGKLQRVSVPGSVTEHYCPLPASSRLPAGVSTTSPAAYSQRLPLQGVPLPAPKSAS